MSNEEYIETPPAKAMELAAATKNPIRKLYFWTLHWADTKYALPALFFISFIESSFFPIPPDVLLMAMCFAVPRKWLTYAFWCTMASMLGGLLGWYIGWGFWELTQGFFFRVIPKFTPEIFHEVQELYQNNDFLTVFIGAFAPIPYKVFTIAAGVCKVNIPTFMVASFLGRGLRFIAVAALIRYFGVKVKPFLEKNFELMTVLFAVLLVLGFVALKYVMPWLRAVL